MARMRKKASGVIDYQQFYMYIVSLSDPVVGRELARLNCKEVNNGLRQEG